MIHKDMIIEIDVVENTDPEFNEIVQLIEQYLYKQSGIVMPGNKDILLAK